MLKKSILLVTAIAAMAAIVVPTAANAQQIKENGVALPATGLFTATSTNWETTTLLGTLKCAKIVTHLTLSTNSTTTSFATASAGHVKTEGCFLNGTTPLKYTNWSAHMHLKAATSGTAAFTFVVDFPTTPETVCDNTTTGTGGAVTWVTNSDSIKMVAPVAAPGCGPGEVKADFTLETANGTTLTVS